MSAQQTSTEDLIKMSKNEELSELEVEQQKLNELQKQVGEKMGYVPKERKLPPLVLSQELRAEADARSVHVANVDYSVTTKELEQHFNGCGAIARVTIPQDRFKGTAKGFAYIEFHDKEGVQNGLAMSDSILKGRQIKVVQKRTNICGFSSTNRQPFGGNGRGRGAGPRVIVKYVYGGGYGAIRGPRTRPGFAPY